MRLEAKRMFGAENKKHISRVGMGLQIFVNLVQGQTLANVEHKVLDFWRVGGGIRMLLCPLRDFTNQPAGDLIVFENPMKHVRVAQYEADGVTTGFCNQRFLLLTQI